MSKKVALLYIPFFLTIAALASQAATGKSVTARPQKTPAVKDYDGDSSMTKSEKAASERLDAFLLRNRPKSPAHPAEVPHLYQFEDRQRVIDRRIINERNMRGEYIPGCASSGCR